MVKKTLIFIVVLLGVVAIAYNFIEYSLLRANAVDVTAQVPCNGINCPIEPKFVYNYQVILTKDLDEYEPTRHENDMTINWVSNEEEVTEAFENYEKEYGISVRGLSLTVEKVCTIWVYEPKTDRDLQTLGHEVLHCFRGKWHSQ